MTRTSALVLLALLGAASAAREEADAGRPVTKVISMLKDMTSQLEKEGEADEETYDAMVCWCETNDKAKTKSIADAELRLQQLESSITENKNKGATLNAELGTLKMERTQNTMALNKATALRASEKEEFDTSEKDSINSIANLKGAVASISAGTGQAAASAALLQKVASVVKDTL